MLPSAEASRDTLIRRIYLDLIGLPPTPDEVDAFLLDNRSDAYEQLVDRLLDSPHYGERWGRHWLDLARYADSDGYEKDSPRLHAWRYRHWVIEALNRDLPFDQFTIEQLAGDLLPDATVDQRIATGFHRNTLTNREGGVDQEEFSAKAKVDRVHTTGTVWLGLTLGCAECHSHKYDPISHREFYGMYAFFDRAIDVDIAAPLPEEMAAYERAKAKHKQQHAPLVAAVETFERDELPARLDAWESSLQQSVLVGWQPLVAQELVSAAGTTLVRQDDHSVLAQGENPEVDTYTLTFRTELPSITALRLEVFRDDTLPSYGPGRAKHGNFVLSRFTATVAPVADLAARQTLTLRRAVATHSQENWDVSHVLDGDSGRGWAIKPQFGRRHEVIFELDSPLAAAPGGVELTIALDQQYGKQHTIGRLRLSVTSSEAPLPDEFLSNRLYDALLALREDTSQEPDPSGRHGVALPMRPGSPGIGNATRAALHRATGQADGLLQSN